MRSDGLLEPAALVAAGARGGVRTLALDRPRHPGRVSVARRDGGSRSRRASTWSPASRSTPPSPTSRTFPTASSTSSASVSIPPRRRVRGRPGPPARGAPPALRADAREAARGRAAGGCAQLEGRDRSDEESLGRPTIARALVAAGFAADVPDAFDRIVGHGRPGYVRREAMGPGEALAAIRGAGGLPVLAHFADGSRAPGPGPRPDRRRPRRDRGPPPELRRGDGRADARRGGRPTGLVPSGGTDFHGDDGTYAEAIAETWVPDDVAEGMRIALAHVPRAVAR